MIGTRAHGRNRTYRYYTCWSRARYDSDRCDFPRLNADAVNNALLAAMADFYRTHHQLIAETVTAHQAQHRAAHTDRRAELATIEAELTKTGHAIERYLRAFETGRMDEELVADRLVQLRTLSKQQRARRDDLAAEIHDEPAAPEPATLHAIADHIDQIITAGTHYQTKALVEALVAHVTIDGPDQLTPTFRIPQPDHGPGTATTDPRHAPAGEPTPPGPPPCSGHHRANSAHTARPARTGPAGPVREMTNLVDLLVRYSNHEGELKHVVKLLLRIEDYDQRDEPGVQLPEPPPLRGLARLSPDDVCQLVASFRMGTPKSVLADRYEISLSTVKRLLKRHRDAAPES
jgi:hypothetical protein